MSTITLYFHIGCHKTATTYLQHAMYANRQKLSENGLCYPDFGIIDGAHHHLGGTVINGLGLGRFARPDRKKYNSLHEIPFWRKLVTTLNSREYPSYLISTEELEWTLDPSVIARYVRRNVPDIDIKVIVYLRRQDKYLESFYQQLVKDANIRERRSFADWLGKPEFIFYDQLVHTWESAFGAGSMIVKLFDDEVKSGLLNGFLGCMQVPVETIAGINAAEANSVITRKESLDTRCLEFLRLCNKVPMDAARHDRILDCLVQVSAKLKGQEQGICTNILSPQQRREIMHSVKESNRTLRKTYFPACGQLFPPLSEDASSEGPLLAVRDIIPELAEAGLF